MTDETLLSPGVQALDAELAEGADYIGTRLHAGIRALQVGARSTIVVIDNRAAEIGRETGIPTVSRSLLDSDEALFGTRTVEVTMPHEEIDLWVSETRAWLSGTEGS
jgi:hypothetical protein